MTAIGTKIKSCCMYIYRGPEPVPVKTIKLKVKVKKSILKKVLLSDGTEINV